MKIDLKAPEIRFALEVIQRSFSLARHIRAESSVKSRLKEDSSPVTLADMGIQAIAGALLEQHFPNAILVGEEDSQHLRTSEGTGDLEKITGLIRPFFASATPAKICEWIDRGAGKPSKSFWTLDPIDGTKGFLRGGQYATALALIEKGRVEVAALGCPELQLERHKMLGKGVGVLAVRGQGCWAFSINSSEDPKEWVRLEVSKCSDIRQARVVDSFDPEHKNDEKNRRVRELLGIKTEPVALDSLAKQAVLASGGAEIFLRTVPHKDPGHREKIWDVAAGALAVEEAGGRVTDLEGRDLDFGAGLTLAKNPGLLATNGSLHGAVLEALQKVTVP